ncbi:hypothetical protein AB0D49_39055 [Streptomyces sp. NPDC048290]|uniref:hypothetical protein n=1 Tax=Streptomyces sp. NPDC048290 TaxID=3155811 RepID=UPI0034278B8F
MHFPAVASLAIALTTELTPLTITMGPVFPVTSKAVPAQAPAPQPAGLGGGETEHG